MLTSGPEALQGTGVADRPPDRTRDKKQASCDQAKSLHAALGAHPGHKAFEVTLKRLPSSPGPYIEGATLTMDFLTIPLLVFGLTLVQFVLYSYFYL